MLEPTALIELVLMDNSGSRGAITLHVPNDTSVAAASSAAIALLAVVAPITGCVIDTLRVRYRTVFDFTTPAADGSSIVRCGVFYFDTAPDEPDALISVPCIVDSVLVTTEPGLGVLIDLTNADILAFVNAIIGVNATSQFGDAITAIVTAYRQSRV